MQPRNDPQKNSTDTLPKLVKINGLSGIAMHSRKFDHMNSEDTFEFT